MEGTSETEARGAALKANILNRFIAKFIDLLVAAALSRSLPQVGDVAAVTYLLIGDGFPEGRSLGKRLIGLHVLVEEGRRACSFRESIIRNVPVAAAYVLLLIPFVGWIFTTVILIVEALLVIGNEKGLRIGDELARTHVRDGEFCGPD